MSFSVRAAKKEDIAALAALERECFSSPWSELSLSESMNSGNAMFFVCERDGEIVGYIGGIFAFDECSVTNVCTSHTCRRQGVAQELMKALERECVHRAISSIFLEVRVSNEGAISLYEKLGYERLGVRRGFYSKPREDAFVYSKAVKS